MTTPIGTTPFVGKTGRIKNDPSRPRITLSTREVLGLAAYSPPLTIDHYSAVPAASWGMDKNDALGDCTVADVDHEVKSDQVTAGNTEVASSEAECVTIYQTVGGYNPADPSTDQGAEMQVVRQDWRKSGFTLGGQTNQILLFAEVDFGQRNLVEWCLDNFGSIGLGINFPDSAMTQFNNGQPWDVVPNAPTPTEGHAIALVGYDETYWYVVTWGKVQKMTPQFFTAYVEECWVSLTADFVNTKSGDTALGQTLYQMGLQFQTVTGQANPVPAPPAPAPTPQPTPVPVPPNPAPSPAPVPTPIPGAAPFPGATVEVAGHISAAAARRKLSLTDYQNRHWDVYFKLIAAELDYQENS